MTKPKWYSQPFPPEGASAAEGIRNQLGRPNLDLPTILVRESAQNSWDARIGDRPVDYKLDLRTVGPAHATAWRELLQEGAPEGERLPLRKALRQQRIRVLSVSDRGTRGLGGPTRADTVITQRHDFVSFVRNVGEPRDNALGGGTYGFGKGIFYLISNSGVVLLHTRCKVEDGYETRLMGCALWASYTANENGTEKRYTGRHWWGDASGPVIEPLVDEAAEQTARRLGLEPFGAEETGTTIVVIDPKLDELDPDLQGIEEIEVAEYLADTIAWQLWPKMLSTQDGQSAMRFSVTCNGVEVPVPDPRETRPLNLFVTAFEKMEGPSGNEVHCGNPKKLLGKLGLIQRHAPPLEPTRASRTSGIDTHIHHVCLMRSAELVVTYHPGPKPPTEFLSYAGVFRADVDVDDAYARAEPPTHDAWNSQSLEYPESRYVSSTFRRLRESTNALLGLDGSLKSGGAAKIALGAASTLLSPLVGGTWGLGGGTDYGRPGSTSAPPRTSVRKNRNDMKEKTPAAETEKSEVETDPSPTNDPETETGTSSTETTQKAEQDAPVSTVTTSTGVHRKPKIEYMGDPYFDEHDGSAVLIQKFRLPVDGEQEVGIDLRVAIAGGDGRETEPPIGAAMPELIGWYDGTEPLSTSPTLLAVGDAGRERLAVIRPAPDTMTEIDLWVKAVHQS